LQIKQKQVSQKVHNHKDNQAQNKWHAFGLHRVFGVLLFKWNRSGTDQPGPDQSGSDQSGSDQSGSLLARVQATSSPVTEHSKYTHTV